MRTSRQEDRNKKMGNDMTPFQEQWAVKSVHPVLRTMQIVGRYLGVFLLLHESIQPVKSHSRRLSTHNRKQDIHKTRITSPSPLSSVQRDGSAQTSWLFSNKLNETDFIHICYQTIQVNVVVRERNRAFFFQGKLKEAFWPFALSNILSP